MLTTKCIYLPSLPDDGTRISVMNEQDQHVFHLIDSEKSFLSYAVWIPSLAPSSKLMSESHTRSLPWESFEQHYLDFLRTYQENRVRAFARLALQIDLVFLCSEKTPDFCHRRLLAEECKRFESTLSLDIK